MKPFLLSALALFSVNAFALPEADLPGAMDSLLANRDGFFTSGHFRGVDALRIGYTRFGNESGPRGCLVISPGQGEPSLKYLELAHDLVARGFSPVYAIDHRGQGASDRLLPDPQKDSVLDFSDYATDFDTFVSRIVLADPLCRKSRPSLLTHSMGGAVAAVYLERMGSSAPFNRVVMSAPMMKILYPNGLSEHMALLESSAACALPVVPGFRCDDYAPGKGPFDPKAPFQGNRYTHSAARFAFRMEIPTRWPELSVGGPTIRWGREAARADLELRERENTRHIAPRVLILQAGKDQLVDNSGQEEFCANTPECRILKLPESKHEIFMESDPVRNRALEAATAFFGN